MKEKGTPWPDRHRRIRKGRSRKAGHTEGKKDHSDWCKMRPQSFFLFCFFLHLTKVVEHLSVSQPLGIPLLRTLYLVLYSIFLFMFIIYLFN